MALFDANAFDELSRRLTDAVPESVRAVGRDLQSNFKSILQSQLAKLDLVSRQEFDVQTALLARTSERLNALELRLKELEAKT